jgi:trafficking protein particle complex subunit 12
MSKGLHWYFHCLVLTPDSPLTTKSPTQRPHSPVKQISRPSSRTSQRNDQDAQPKDLSFLLLPQNFLPVPPPLVNPPSVEPTLAILPDLVKSGRFYSAATVSAQLLTNLPFPPDPTTIFNLLYTRLACLTLIQQTKLAAAESKVLGDLSSPFYRDPSTNKHIVPWDLRVLCVRLQALGFGEWRRGIMAYYILAQEARQEAIVAGHQDRNLWTSRLHDLGIRVASALVEMGDLEAASRHLRTLEEDRDTPLVEKRRLMMMETLIWLKVGDLDAALACLSRNPDSEEILGQDSEDSTKDDNFSKRVLTALVNTCTGDLATAVPKWQALNEEFPGDATIQQNLAVCLMYAGEMTKSRDILETLANNPSTPVFQSLLFNLATIYELSTENSPALKMRLAGKVASNDPDGAGLERAKAEFKL